ncbi:hypothetical protein SS1G_12289 [Sclerotinia sclerotiorum 1980 UF-70]|uniref:FAD-binding PCMH-type domain-containing protein n=1 Tax=Sclerotinia sclerotiorum (strain ATCC 18683 / 1980 / Ss-1) TaxID=665079 RepID=A7F2Z1_SCLS1|nr:hypothetical protein SS1G_12289 [Sclerotinia sclerotiorum 1980 UF-70]EDN96083.1 hypothetical protein SS1G_12289 [Sclerotinia sclerotiorum 1980 UF-70]
MATTRSPVWSEACRLEAQCVVSPSSTEEISLIMKIISFLHVSFAVRSGGHSPNPNWSSIDSNGILISTSNLDSINVSPDNSMASIGSGLRWGAVYEALDSYGVSVIGGRVPQVGVGGLSHFSAQHGLAADNVKDFEVVLTSGEIVNANADTNSGLFWALKGGGPNFGLVYSEPATYPEAFAPFAAIPNGIVRISPTNATVTFLSTILGTALAMLLRAFTLQTIPPSLVAGGLP